jgi:hypothetical protein
MPEVNYDDPDFNPLRNVILPDAKKQPDRHLAIVLAAVVEDGLAEALKARLVKNERITKKLLGSMGPLGTFAAKIDMGLLVGLYREDFAKMLHALREIRNKFAHEMRPLTLESEEIKAKAQGFVIYDQFHAGRRRKSERDRFVGACEIMLAALHIMGKNARRLAPSKKHDL